MGLCSQTLISLSQQLEQNKLQYHQQLVVCQQQENLIENLTNQRDTLRLHYETFLEQVGLTDPLLEETVLHWSPRGKYMMIYLGVFWGREQR